jgi:hypothetical protein
MGLWENFKGFFKRKKKVICVFIDETGRQDRRAKKYKNNIVEDNHYGAPMSYVIDHDKMVYERRSGLPVAYFNVNDPVQLDMRHEQNPEMDAKGLRQVIQSKAIKDIFEDDSANLILIILILVCICLLGIIILGAHDFGFIKTGGNSTKTAAFLLLPISRLFKRKQS